MCLLLFYQHCTYLRTYVSLRTHNLQIWQRNRLWVMSYDRNNQRQWGALRTGRIPLWSKGPMLLTLPLPHQLKMHWHNSAAPCSNPPRKCHNSTKSITPFNNQDSLLSTTLIYNPRKMSQPAAPFPRYPPTQFLTLAPIPPNPTIPGYTTKPRSRLSGTHKRKGARRHSMASTMDWLDMLCILRGLTVPKIYSTYILSPINQVHHSEESIAIF